MLNATMSDVKEMKAPRLLRRILSSAPAPSTLPSRTSIRPPAIWGQAEPVWKALWNWLRPRQQPAERRALTLDDARRDFAQSLADLTTEDACDLRRRGQSARSLRELWHLRADLYSMVARHHSQGEADRRLQLVNRHFPTSTKPTTTSAASRPEHFDA
ncbi:hypothetical protein [Ideonella sp.]|uniref:hypothetical protein n=1 Tax=Ideonella sp. TaxID=1929293 RepID=UPI002E358BD6|nr:hypothetical protein [Ideonella sp.]